MVDYKNKFWENPEQIANYFCEFEDGFNKEHFKEMLLKAIKNLIDQTASQPGVEADRRSRCTICGKEIILICKKCGKPPEPTTTAA